MGLTALFGLISKSKHKYLIGMGRYWYRYQQYRHIGILQYRYWRPDTADTPGIGSIGVIGKGQYRHIGVSAKMWYRANCI